MVEDKVAVTEDLQEQRQFTFTFIQPHQFNLIPSRSQCLHTEEDMEVAVINLLAVMEDRQEVTFPLRLCNLINSQCLLMEGDMEDHRQEDTLLLLRIIQPQLLLMALLHNRLEVIRISLYSL